MCVFDDVIFFDAESNISSVYLLCTVASYFYSEGGTHCVPIIVHGSVISCSCETGCFFIYQNNAVCNVYIQVGGVKTFSLQSLEWGTI